MQRKPRILVVGSFVMDVIATTEQIPAAGQTVYGKSFHTASGGKGANQALQCARLGAEVTMMGCVGDDLFGRQLLETPRQAGVDVSHVVTRPGISSGVGHVVLEVTEHTAQNRIVVIPGANRTLTVEDVAFLEPQMSSFDMVGSSAAGNSPGGQPGGGRLGQGRRCAGDAESCSRHRLGRPAFKAGYLSHSQRAGSFCGNRPPPANGPAGHPAGRLVIITLGGSGSAVVLDGGIQYIPCVHMDHVADPTAAGDSFVAALSVALSIGLPQEEALAFASHTAAITVSRMGAMPSLPTLDEVIQLLQERNYQGFDLSLLDVLR